MSAQILSCSHFPFRCLAKGRFSNIVTLGLGSNEGNSLKILEQSFAWFAKHSKIQILWSSPVWRNPPFGYTQQNDFYNAVLMLNTSLSIVEIYALIFYVERRFGRGRKRVFKNAPRTLDIDIIFFNDIKIQRDYLSIPHQSHTQRPSVMLPLSFWK